MTEPLPSSPKKPVPSRPPPFFRELERRARRLQLLLLVLVLAIAILSTGVFVYLEIGHLRRDARDYAQDCASVVAAVVKEEGPRRETLREKLRATLVRGRVLRVRLLGPGTQQWLSVGGPVPTFLSHASALELTGLDAPFRVVEVTVDARSLPWQATRVLLIHLLVATVLGVILYRLPVLALRRAIDELEVAEGQLMHSARLSAIGEMYASLTHEINNPTGIILTRVKLMLASAAERRLPDDVIRDLEIIDRHGTRIAEIIRSLLAFTRTTRFELRETDLNQVIAEALALVERPFAKQGIRIERQLRPDLAPIAASPQHLQQVFMNLLNNARDAMPGGGTITLRTVRNGRSVVADVEDTGTGVPDELQSRIFEPFFTTKEVGEGTGLGLSVSYGIIRAHGGDIEVRSGPKEGARFRLTLPIEGAPA